MSIRITTLGTLRVTQGDRIISALPSQRLRAALLIHLAVVRETTRDRLLLLFWPDRSEDKARHALSQNIYELRRVLGDEWIEVRGEQFIVARDVSVDVIAFDEAVDRSDFGGALSLYRGQFLDGFYLPDSHAFETWVDAQRMKGQRQHRRARREYIRQLVDMARMREATIAAREWVAIDGTDDEGQHRLIELLADAGDRAGAIRQYESYERLLKPDDLMPLEETRALIERIRAGGVGDLPGIPVRAVPAAHAPVPPAVPAAIPGPVTPAAPLPVSRPAFAGMSAAPPLQRRRGVPVLVLVVAIIAVLSSAYLYSLRANTPERPDAVRLAILYFDDISEKDADANLSSALTEALIDEFSNIDTTMMVVRSRSASGRFRDVDDLDSLRIALDVDMVVSGTLMQEGNQVRVSARLTDLKTGAVPTTVSVTGSTGNRFNLIDDLSTRIGTLLRHQIGIAEEAGFRRSPAARKVWVAVTEAREMASAAMNNADQTNLNATHTALARADSMLQVAERIDRRNVEPILERGRVAERRALVELISSGGKAAARPWLDSMKHHADRAILINPRSAAAYEQRANAYGRLEGFIASDAAEREMLSPLATRDYRTALRLDPRRPQAWARLATLLYREGNYEEAITVAGQSRKVDPYARETGEALNIAAMAEFENGHDDHARDACMEGKRRFGDTHVFRMCNMIVGAWADDFMSVDSAWAIASKVSESTTTEKTFRPAFDMLVAVVLARHGLADSALAVVNRASGQPSLSTSVDWLEPAVRGLAHDTETAAAQFKKLLAEVDSRFYRESRALEIVFRDPALRKAMGVRPIGSGG